MHGTDAQEDEPDILGYWRSVTKRKWSILALAATVALLAAVIAYSMTPVYRSTAVLLIEANKPKLLSIENAYSGVVQNREYLQTQIEIIRSREVAVKAAIQLKLWEHPDYDPRIRKTSVLTGVLDAIGFSEDIQPQDWPESALVDAVAGSISGHLSVELVRNSQLVTISFESTDAALAAKVANTVVSVYIEKDLEERYKMTKQASTWFQDHLGDLKNKLDASETSLQAYREKADIVDIKSAAQSGAGKQFEDLTTRTVEARMRRAEAENAYKLIKNAPKEADISSFPAVLRNPVVADAKKQEVEAERKLSEVSQRYGREHPKYIQATAELTTARENVRRQVDSVVASVTREYEMARLTERTLESALVAARGSIQNLNRKEFELGVLEREAESNRQMYDLFMKRAKETNVSGDLQTPVARVVDPAMPGGLIKPQKQRIILIGFFSGLAVGMLISLLQDQLDNTLKTTADVERKLKQPLLTSLPLLNKKELARTSTARLFLDNPKSVYSEAIRTARTGVLLSSIDLPNRILLVTSSVPGEGKTTFAINLAMAHAQTKRTLLIDSDLRRPDIANRLGLPEGAMGLTNLVSDSATLEECLLSVRGSDLKVILSGTIPPNPLELLHSLKFQKTLNRLAEWFDVIVMNSPPVELVSDALVIGSHVTGVIFVVKAMHTPFQLVRKSILRMKRADGHILGVVLNQLDFKKAQKYHGEFSGYGNYGYGDKTYGEVYGNTLGREEPSETSKT
ncbi:MAG: polysaccharide biosynthesis tyrosine autokinase [Proteobacteria bacterium]|nr:polysaccharide biosynthesis tyrosine autokinase [Pseudomonadota bacterium]